MMLCILGGYLCAQSSPSTISNYEFEFMTLPDGNSIGYVNSIVQDQFGLLWLAGDQGLMLFDGRTFEVFNRDSDQNNLDISSTNKIYEYSEEQIILLENTQLHWFNVTSRSITKSIIIPDSITKESQKKFVAMDMAFGLENELWILIEHTENNLALWILDQEEQWHFIDELHHIHFPRISTNGRDIAVGRVGGVNLYDIRSRRRNSIDVKSEDRLFYPYSMFWDSNGIFWMKGDCELETFEGQLLDQEAIAKTDCGIYFLPHGASKLQTNETIRLADLKGSFYLNKLDERFWVGGTNLMLKEFDETTNLVLDHTPHLLNSFNELSRSPFFTQILKVFKDREGTIWILSTAGLIKAIPNPKKIFDSYLRSNRQICQSVCVFHGITEDHQGNIFAAFNNDLMRIDYQTKEAHYIAEKPNSYDQVTSYSVTYSDEAIYWNDFSYDLQSGRFQKLHEHSGKEEICHFLDRKGKLWIEVNTGRTLSLNVGDPSKKNFHRLKVSAAFKQASHIHQILQSKKDGHLWIATMTGGLFEFSPDGQELNHYSSSENSVLRLQEDYVGGLYEDEHFNLWIGTREGLGKIDAKRQHIVNYENYFRRHNNTLFKREIYSILGAGSGRLLLSTNKGIIRFNKHDSTFESLNGLDELHDGKFNRQSAHQAKDGTYYFGSVNGLFSFRLEDIEPYFSKGTSYDLVLSKVRVYNDRSSSLNSFHPKDINGGIVMTHRDLYIDVNYVLPDYQLYSKILYSYKIGGFDQDWSTPTNNTQVRINRLPPGNYEFLVRAGYEIDALDYSTSSFSLQVKMAWYNTWIFRILSALFLGLVIYALLRYRFNLREERRSELEALRQKISSDLHDDVGSTLSGLSMQAQVLAFKAQGKQKEMLRQISDMSHRAMETMRDTVWAIDSRQDQFGNLLDRMRDYAERNLVNADIRFQIDSDGLDTGDTILPNIRQQFYLIYKEAITNVIRHSNASQVNVNLSRNDVSIRLSIKDNGSQINKTSRTGQGTKNMAMRAKKVGGEVVIEKQNGYSVEVIMPI